MKIRNSKLNTKRFAAEAKSLEIRTLQQMLDEFGDIIEELTKQVVVEEEHTGIFDASHFAYSTFARAAVQRRANLYSSIADLKVKLEKTTNEYNKILIEIELAEKPYEHESYKPLLNSPALT
ncbi:MAG: flagellar export protein FliJ [Hyphomicrobiaceae bacterium]|nr:flagellar export protein FliJ [Hyphomicrobiaceae bacterium]